MWDEFWRAVPLLFPMLALTIWRAVTMAFERRLRDVTWHTQIDMLHVERKLERLIPAPLTPEQEWDAEMALHLERKQATVHADTDARLIAADARIAALERELARTQRALKAVMQDRCAERAHARARAESVAE